MWSNKLFNLDKVSKQDILDLFQIADDIKSNGVNNLYRTRYYLKQKTLVTLFLEPSTRTHYSFLIAGHKLGMNVIDFKTSYSSLKKEESLYDTIKTLSVLSTECLVIRHPQNEYYKELENIDIPIINGGDGTGNHPTQSLLDLYTIYKQFGHFDNIKILIVGDVKHSRVAKTNRAIMEKLGMIVHVSGPKTFNAYDDPAYVDLKTNVSNYDVIMLLRYQKERHDQTLKENYKFFVDWSFTKELYNKLKEEAIIMHPGPFNRDVEIESSLVEANKSRIFQQMENGLYIRIALIWSLVNEK